MVEEGVAVAFSRDFFGQPCKVMLNLPWSHVVEAVMPQAIPRAESTHGRCEELRCCFL